MILLRQLPHLVVLGPAATAAAHGATQLARCSTGAVFTQPSDRWRTIAKYGAVVGATIWASQQPQIAEPVRLAWLIPSRLAQDALTAASIVADYKLSLRGAEASGEEREAMLRACHQRSADKLVQLCFLNGGIYIKLGQHLGQLDHLLPEQYVLTMRQNLLNKCPLSSYEDVRGTITRDLGAPPEELFETFEPAPIASASLAQVHVATLREDPSRKLAVKVQHAGLRETSDADITTVEFLVNLVSFVFPEFNYTWLVEEIKENLPQELDFAREAANAERCRTNLASSRSRLTGRVVVPEIYHNLSSTRVLTMEFVEGVGVTDLAALRALRVDRCALARLISETFNEMIFTFGDVHADPHAANMLVRRTPAGKMQLVLLDHGLYRRLDDAFRRQYALLWRSLIFADEAGIRSAAAAMNAAEVPQLFAGLMTQRPWEQIVDASGSVERLAIPGTEEDRELLQSYAQQYMREVGELLLRMPRELLLLLKTNDCLRSVDRALGCGVSSFATTARECARALAELRCAKDPGWRSWLAAQGEVLQVEARMAALQVLVWWSRLRAALRGGRATKARRGGVNLQWKRHQQQQQVRHAQAQQA